MARQDKASDCQYQESLSSGSLTQDIDSGRRSCLLIALLSATRSGQEVIRRFFPGRKRRL